MRHPRGIRWALTAGVVVVAVGLTAAPAPAAVERIVASAHVQARPLPVGAPATTAPAQTGAIPLLVLNPAAYASAKRAAAGHAGTGSSPLSGESPAAPAVSTQTAVFGGLTAAGLSAAQQISAFGNNVTPPDTTGAIGPADYVEIVNAEVAVYDRTNLSLIGSPMDVAAFTGGVSPCDVQIKYDPSSDRWFYVALRCDDTTSSNQLYVGWSKTSDPSDLTGGWCRFSVASTPATTLDDYPKLGLDGSNLIIGTNNFDAGIAVGENNSDASGSGFLTAHILVAAKPLAGTLGACTPPNFAVFGSAAAPLPTAAGNAAFTPEPATISDRSGTTGYVVAADLNTSFTGSNLMVWRIDGSGTSSSLVPLGDVPVGSFSIPPAVPQPGTSDPIDSLDGRLTQAVAANDPGVSGDPEAVWTQHTVSNGPGSSKVAWYELIPATKTLVQSGTITDPSSGFAFNGAIAPTRNGGAVIDYDVGGSSQQVTLEAESQNRGGTMSSPVQLATSSAIDSDFSCPSLFNPSPSCRWGDYAGASVDPDNPDVAWGSNQVNGPTAGPSGNQAQWQTQNFALTPTSTPAPTASFTATPGLVAPGAAVAFDATASSAGITNYSWDFGDHQTSSGATPTTTHAYAAAGVYFVTLTVTGSGGTSSTSHVVTVDAPPAPTFTVSASPVLPGGIVSFNGSGSSDPNPGGTIVAYSWNFGDGSSGSGATATHAFGTPAIYTVTLTTTDDHGQTSSATGTVTVDRPTPSFTVSANPVAPGATVAFNAGSSTDPAGAIVSYSWNFGDGTSGSGPGPTHAFAAPGNYLVTLTVTNGYGQTASASNNIIVNPPPTASFKISPNPATIGSAASMDASASSHPFGTVASYTWSFGDGGTATGVAATHTYASRGTYAVTLTVTDSDGQVGTSSADIVANPPQLTGQVSIPGGQKLAGIRKNGLTVTLKTNQGNKAIFKVTATIKPAKKGQKPSVITLLSNRKLTVKRGTNQLKLKLNAKQLNKLPAKRSIVLTVTATITDAFSQTLTLPARLTVKS